MPEKHFIEVENNEEVAAVHHEADSEKWIVFCHGFGSDKDGSYVGRCERAVEEGFNAVRFDFRGNGESDGKFIDQDISSRIADLEAVVDYFDPQEYVLFGTSLGAFTVFQSLEDLEPEAVVAKSPATYDAMENFREAVKNKGTHEFIDGKPIDERFYEDRDRYSFEDVEEIVEVPVLMIQGGADTTVHPEVTFRAARNLNADVTVEKYKGERHRFSDEGDEKLRKDTFAWLERKL